MKEQLTDKECARRIRGGDLELFSGLIREYSPRMLNLALGIVRQREAAADVVQDALVKAYEKLGSWRGDSALSTWLYRIVYTTAVSSLRGRRDISGEQDALPDAVDDGGGWEVTEQNITKMGRALEMLSPLDRTLVNLFYIEEKPVRDVAKICAESEANVKTRLHRARGRLRNIMNEMR